MADLIETLHDEIDVVESLTKRARDAVDARAGKLLDLIDEVGDLEEALAAMAALVEDDLTDLTTEAVHFGRDAYLKRAKVK